MRLPSPSLFAPLDGHVGAVNRALVMPGGAQVLTAGMDGVVILHHLNSNAKPRKFARHSAPITAMEDLGANLVATGDAAGVLYVWRADREMKAVKRVVTGLGAIWSIAMLDPASTGDGRFVVGTDAGKIVFAQHAEGEDVRGVHMGSEPSGAPVFALAAFPPRFVAGLGNGTMTVFRSNNFSRFQFLRDPEVTEGRAEAVGGVAMNKEYVVAAVGPVTSAGNMAGEGWIRVWKVDETDKHGRFKVLHKFCCGSFGDPRAWRNGLSRLIIANGMVLTAALEEKRIDLTDLETGELLSSVKLELAFRDVAVDGNARIYAVCGRSSTSGPAAGYFPNQVYEDEEEEVDELEPQSFAAESKRQRRLFAEAEAVEKQRTPQQRAAETEGADQHRRRLAELQAAKANQEVIEISDGDCISPKVDRAKAPRSSAPVLVPSAHVGGFLADAPMSRTSVPAAASQAPFYAAPDTDEFDLPNFAKMKKMGVRKSVIEEYNLEELCELFAAYFVGFVCKGRADAQRFISFRDIFMVSFEKIGVFSASALLGDEPDVDKHTFVKAGKEGLEANGRFVGYAERKLGTFYEECRLEQGV